MILSLFRSKPSEKPTVNPVPDVDIPAKTFKIETKENDYGDKLYYLYTDNLDVAHAFFAVKNMSWLFPPYTKWYSLSANKDKEVLLKEAQATYEEYLRATELRKRYTYGKVSSVEYIS